MSKMLKAVRWEILRGVESNGRKSVPLSEKPIRVATVINEQKLLDDGVVLRHHHNVFLEDRMHDWDWANGDFRYYSRVAEKADVLVVYELAAD